MNSDTKEKFIELRGKGYSFDSISKQLKVSKPTLLKLGRELADEVNEQKFLEMELLAEKFRMMRAARIERLGSTLERVRTAADQADFSRLPADKLADCERKLTEALRAELRFSHVDKGALSEKRHQDTMLDFETEID